MSWNLPFNHISQDVLRLGAGAFTLAALGFGAYRFYLNRLTARVREPLEKAEAIYKEYYDAKQPQKEEMAKELQRALETIHLQGIEGSFLHARIHYLIGRFFLDQKEPSQGLRNFHSSVSLQLIGYRKFHTEKVFSDYPRVQNELTDRVETLLKSSTVDEVVNLATGETVEQAAQFAFSLLGIGDAYSSNLPDYLSKQRAYVDKIYTMARRIFQHIDLRQQQTGWRRWTSTLPFLSSSSVKLEPHKDKSLSPFVVSVEKIWDVSPHNAFTDLIEYKGHLMVCFRESDKHDGGNNGTIRILKQENGKWTSLATLSHADFDLRDPKFSIMPNGKLLVTLGGEVWEKQRGEQKLKSLHSLVTTSEDGIHWEPIQEVNNSNPNQWIWRVTWHQGIGYGVSYSLNPGDNKSPWTLILVKTRNGIHYENVVALNVPDRPSEVTLRFLRDGTMIALARRSGTSWIGTATAPYKDWKWEKAGSNVGGPNFLVLPDGSMFASGRLFLYYKENNKLKELSCYTAVGPMTSSSYKPEVILPSGDDTSYPGLHYDPNSGQLLVSYYSSHEGKPNIYFARVHLPLSES